MLKLSRREFLASSTVFTLAAAYPAHAAAAWVQPVDVTIGHGPPVAPVIPVVENYFGQSVTDRYRWMEAEGPQWQDYVRAQGAYTQAVLAKIPGRDRLAADIAAYTGALAAVMQVQLGGAKIFTERRPAGANTSKL